MKNLFIIRHAKSSWDSPMQKDFERSLNDRGHKDAPEMASRLLKKGIKIDAFVSSTANRAFTTATYFAKAYGKTAADIIAIPELYHASIDTFFTVVSTLDNSFNSVAIFSHNPGITAFVNLLTKVRVDNMPTCSIFAVSAETNEWATFLRSPKTFLFFDYPKLAE